MNPTLIDILLAIGEQLRTQDNRITAEPMFCVQERKRTAGLDTDYSETFCWINSEEDDVVYDDDPGFKEPTDIGWEKYGYTDHWETVMVAFTEAGCKDYLELNGHNHRGPTRIYVESFRRCPEMIAIRAYLMDLKLIGDQA